MSIPATTFLDLGDPAAGRPAAVKYDVGATVWGDCDWAQGGPGRYCAASD